MRKPQKLFYLTPDTKAKIERECAAFGQTSEEWLESLIHRERIYREQCRAFAHELTRLRRQKGAV